MNSVLSHGSGVGTLLLWSVSLGAFPPDRRVPAGAGSVHRSQGKSRTVSGCWSHRSTHINPATYCQQAKENVTPTYSAAYDMMNKK
jgi:hypothetical protein